VPTGFMKLSGPDGTTGIGANPQRAVDLVTGADIKQSLAEAWTGDPKTAPAYPNFCDRISQFRPSALLMNGTTSELQTALREAVNAGTQAFWASGDQLLVWYLRRKAGMETKSLILMAPKYKYLNVQNDDPLNNYANQGQGQGWRFLCKSAHDDGVDYYRGMSLNWFLDYGLEPARNQDAWW
jgi:hypothetical protein